MLALNTAIAARRPARHRFNLAARHIAARNRFNGSPRFRCGFFLGGGALARATGAPGGRLDADAVRAGPQTCLRLLAWNRARALWTVLAVSHWGSRLRSWNDAMARKSTRHLRLENINKINVGKESQLCHK